MIKKLAAFLDEMSECGGYINIIDEQEMKGVLNPVSVKCCDWVEYEYCDDSVIITSQSEKTPVVISIDSNCNGSILNAALAVVEMLHRDYDGVNFREKQSHIYWGCN